MSFRHIRGGNQVDGLELGVPKGMPSADAFLSVKMET